MAGGRPLLHVVWSIVRELEYFISHGDPFERTAAVGKRDWEQLGGAQMGFRCKVELADVSAALIKECFGNCPNEVRGMLWRKELTYVDEEGT